jgi:mannose-6-phosphate isomerase-like protein (cupin superfamily)
MTKYQVFNPDQQVSKLPEMEFSTLADFGTGHVGVFWSEESGPGPWEMHPDSDELLHVIEGCAEIEILPRNPAQSSDLVKLEAGAFLVVPQGLWHRHNMLARTKEMYLSPAETEHSNESDPRA